MAPVALALIAGGLRRIPRVAVKKVLLDDLPRGRRDVVKDRGRYAEPRRNRQARPLQADQIGGLAADGVWRGVFRLLPADDSGFAHNRPECDNVEPARSYTETLRTPGPHGATA